MSTANDYLIIAGLSVDVVYKDIKNMHISVYPPLGRVRVAAPSRLDESSIRLAIVHRLPWIRRQQERLSNAHRQSQREMVTGESHHVWGQRLRLDLQRHAGRPQLDISGKNLVVSGPESMTDTDLRNLLDKWYRSQLKVAIPKLIEKWEPIIGVSISKWNVRRMKTKWGTCNPDRGSLAFNLELAKKDYSCLEYIVVHEMTHFLERSHDSRFVSLMDKFLPNWRQTREVLNAAPLSHENWSE